jgi:hypothetical protein
MAGYSEELRGLLRVYPLPVINPIHARQVCVLDLERNPRDSRIESWKLKDHDRSILDVSTRHVPTCKLIGMLRRHLASSIAELNERRLSLGVIEAAGCRGEFVGRSSVNHPCQGTFFDFADADHRFGAKALDVAPYLSFFDPAGTSHRLQLREWGAYEWVRKNRAEATQLWRNIGAAPDRPLLLIVGNLANCRNTWLIIKTFDVERAETPLLAIAT